MEWLEKGSNGDQPIDLWIPTEMRYIIYQLEAGSHLHVQGYVQFKKQYRLGTAQAKIHPTAHMEVARGSPSQNVKYCSKHDETYCAGPWSYGEVQVQGQRNDLMEVCEEIKSGVSLCDIAESHSETYVRNYRGLQQLALRTSKSPKWRNVITTVIWGRTGTGKTRTAFESCDDPYFVLLCDNAKWWDGYEGQETVIFDDFYGQVKPDFMLRLLDGYPCQLSIKGSFTWAKWTRVYITSNSHPCDWYPSIPQEARDAIMRRISEVIHMS